jgi:small subunit ribosomal protein S21
MLPDGSKDNNINIKEVIKIAYIVIRENEELERAIKRFKRQVEKEGIIKEFKKRQYFEKPSTIKHEIKKSRKRKEEKRKRKLNRKKLY